MSYTAIELTEFIVRARSKVAELALDIVKLAENEGVKTKKVLDKVELTTDLIDFVNMIESNFTFNTIPQKDIDKIVDWMDDRYVLSERPLIIKDPFSKTDRPPSATTVTQNVDLPIGGPGYLYKNHRGVLEYRGIEQQDNVVFRGKLEVFEEDIETIYPDGSLIIVYSVGKDEELVRKLKIGEGRTFQETPYIDGDSRFFIQYPEDSQEVPEGHYSDRVLTEDGWKFLPLPDAIDMKGNKLSDRMTLSEDDYGKLQDVINPYKVPTITLNGDYTARAVGVPYTGPLKLSMSFTNLENLESLYVTASDGDWEGLGDIPIGTLVELSLNSPLVRNQMGNVTITVTGSTTKGGTVTSTYNMPWRHNIYYGCSTDPGVEDPNTLTGLGIILTTSRSHNITFNPQGQQHQVVFIPEGIGQSGIDIRNAQLPSFPHSMGMNSGEGGTAFRHKSLINGVMYNVYVTYNTTDAEISCIIQ